MPTAISFFPVGSSVTLQKLVNASQYNGLRGTVQSGIDPQTLRQEVSIDIDGEKKILAAKPANLKPFSDDVLTMSIKELLGELAEYQISTDTLKDKQSLQEAVIAARNDGWRRPTLSSVKTPPPAAAASAASSDDCHVGSFSSGYNSSKKRAASASNSKPSKKTKTNASTEHGSLPELALASKYDEGMTVTGYYMSEKLDGMRCLWDGLGNLYSRNHNVIHAPSFFTQALPKGIALDGELFLGRGEFQECISIVKQIQPDEQDWRRVTFYVFDAPTITGGFETRLQAAKDALSNTDTSIARVLAQVECRGKDHLREEFARIKKQNGEGIILRKPNAPYRRGKRTSDLLKYKAFVDAEAKVIGYQDGKGKHSGRMGALLCQMLDTTKAEFKVGTGFSDVEREWENAPSIGSTITYRYFELTDDGKPRHPTFVRVRPSE